ncbi:MAG: MoxR family ATPase [Deltaproteobacteria bacterium]|nr:MoxR family ATPase [Deltaproteobacteria bacterium]
MTTDSQNGGEKSAARLIFQQARERLATEVVGQEKLIERLLITLLADGHLLVEGAPGLAKTRAVKSLAACIEGDFQRLQFTPDLLPADLTGTEIYQRHSETFRFQPGPLFHNVVLADEINRAPAKVQAALLEAMSERQISVGRRTHKLPDLFMVMATQNPIEQEGTYPLPEAQLDRFLMKVLVDYPDHENEKIILELARREMLDELEGKTSLSPVLSPALITRARREVLGLYMADTLKEYLVQLILATRNPRSCSTQLDRWLEYGASPRGTIALDRCARAHAWLQGREFITPANIQAVVYDVLRHRLILTYEAEAEGITSEKIIAELLRQIPVP